MIDSIKKDATQRMVKGLEALKNTYAKLRTGRAHPGLLDHVTVDYYGAETALSSVASVVVEDARTISITPWERNMVAPIEKAIMKSDLGLNPSTSGTTIRLIMPALTEERRRDLVKIVKNETEASRVSLRGVRRDAMQQIKELVKAKLISTDDEKRAEADIQKITDAHIAKGDEMMMQKEKEMMSM